MPSLMQQKAMQSAGMQTAIQRGFISRLWIVVTLLPLLCTAQMAYAAYGSVTQDSDIDPTIVKIDENAFLGEKIAADYALMDQNGTEFTTGDLLGKPLILALSYYTCDGACSALNSNLRMTLDGVDDWKLGKDYRVLTVSFDRHDTTEKLQTFMHKSGFADALPAGWRMATMKNPEDIKRLTDSMGFKFFWSPRDALFLHPSVYIMLSPEGRVTRYLYGASVAPEDIEFSITKAYGEELSPANVINFIVGACYSYNFKDGKYKVNIPLFVAAGGLIFGVGLIITGYTIMKHRRERDENKIVTV